MRKKCFLALLLAVSLLLSGCALVTVDEQADNARVVLDVNGEKVTKGVLNNAVDYQLSQNEQMNYYYQLFGLSGTYSTDRATVQSQVVDSYQHPGGPAEGQGAGLRSAHCGGRRSGAEDRRGKLP